MQPVALLLFVAVAACAPIPEVTDAGDGGSTADAGGCANVARPDAGDFPSAVFIVLRAKCQGCHADPVMHGATFPMLTWEDTQKRFGITDHQRWERMAEVIEPGGLPHMPFQTAPQLTDGELATLRAWFGACALPVDDGQGCDGLSDGGLESSRCDAGPT